MPRGIYDRSKLKKNKTESTETVVTAAPKGKPGRKPGRKAGSTTVLNAAPAVKTSKSNTIELMSEVRANLATLSSLKTQFPQIAAIGAEVQAHVEVLGKLSREAFGIAETVTETKPAVANGASTVVAMPAVPLPPNTMIANAPTTQS